jgi:hypothetical protein
MPSSIPAREATANSVAPTCARWSLCDRCGRGGESSAPESLIGAAVALLGVSIRDRLTVSILGIRSRTLIETKPLETIRQLWALYRRLFHKMAKVGFSSPECSKIAREQKDRPGFVFRAIETGLGGEGKSPRLTIWRRPGIQYSLFFSEEHFILSYRLSNMLESGRIEISARGNKNRKLSTLSTGECRIWGPRS